MKIELQAPDGARLPAGSDEAPGPATAPPPRGLSLHAKGLVVFSILFVYVLVVIGVVALQWHNSLSVGDKIEHLHLEETKAERLQGSLSHAIINLQDTLKSGNPKDLDTDLELLLSDARRLEAHYPQLSAHARSLAGDLARLQPDMTDAALRSLRARLEAVRAEVDDISTQIHESKEALTAAHFAQQSWIATGALAMSLGGVALFGVLIVLFFNRLARDIGTLEARAMEIVTGYDGAPLEVTRGDEVGGLMRAVNRTQSAMRHREKQLELAREQRFYQDKMAAIGSLAAGVAHEINNPIAAISGFAQSMSDHRRANRCTDAGCRPELILEQTGRIATITRQLAEMASARSEQPDLVDLNGLVERTSNFLGYDKRFRGIDIVLDLDRDVPAVHSVADHLTQILMNLMINAADALDGARGGARRIRVATRAEGGDAVLTVSDNGHGMDRALLARVFDESFTTKPLDKGRGLGLFLCKNLIEQNAGRIELESVLHAGTTARVVLPLREPATA
ncbi:MAG: ATP-binding protein [Betaproteobacteria bacterium]|nr:ATP-binding protein [Betaproteobacteria bacterium]